MNVDMENYYEPICQPTQSQESLSIGVYRLLKGWWSGDCLLLTVLSADVADVADGLVILLDGIKDRFH